MNSRQTRIAKRNERIKKEFLKLGEKRHNGRRIYTNEYIFEILADKYALSPITIEKIIFERIKYQK